MFPAVVEQIVSERRAEAADGIVLVGSFARGDQDAFSDIDLRLFVSERNKHKPELFWRDGHLISLTPSTIADFRWRLTHPESALRLVPALRSARVLSDPKGHLSQLCAACRSFQWQHVQAQAIAQACDSVHHQIEVVHKLCRHLQQGCEDPVVTIFIAELSSDMLRAMMLAEGVFVDSCNVELARVYSACAGSDWPHWHQTAIGSRAGTSLVDRTRAALMLFEVTCRHLRAAFAPAQLQAVSVTIERYAGFWQ